MTTAQIVNYVNAKLAGEMLTYTQLLVHLDAAVDDINRELNSCFPVFSEFETNKALYPDYPDYNFIPDRVIRMVIVVGVAYKFYITDEEGSMTAQQYSYDYKDALFYLKRDYCNSVPEQYQADNQGYIDGPGGWMLNRTQPITVRDWFLSD